MISCVLKHLFNEKYLKKYASSYGIKLTIKYFITQLSNCFFNEKNKIYSGNFLHALDREIDVY